MNIVVVSEGNNDIHLTEMKDGQLAMITSWTYNQAIGNIVHRYGNILVRIGKPSGSAWTSIDQITRDKNPLCRVRILPVGTTLRLEA